MAKDDKSEMGIDAQETGKTVPDQQPPTKGVEPKSPYKQAIFVIDPPVATGPPRTQVASETEETYGNYKESRNKYDHACQEILDAQQAYNAVIIDPDTNKPNPLGRHLRPTTPPMEKVKKQIRGLLDQGVEVPPVLVKEMDVPVEYFNELIKKVDRLKIEASTQLRDVTETLDRAVKGKDAQLASGGNKALPSKESDSFHEQNQKLKEENKTLRMELERLREKRGEWRYKEELMKEENQKREKAEEEIQKYRAFCEKTYKKLRILHSRWVTMNNHVASLPKEDKTISEYMKQTISGAVKDWDEIRKSFKTEYASVELQTECNEYEQLDDNAKRQNKGHEGKIRDAEIPAQDDDNQKAPESSMGYTEHSIPPAATRRLPTIPLTAAGEASKLSDDELLSLVTDEDFAKMDPSVNLQIKASIRILCGVRKALTAKDKESMIKCIKHVNDGREELSKFSNNESFAQLVQLADPIIKTAKRDVASELALPSKGVET
ncbi:hypothetical protein FBEOM_12358, partial [Fusarium beomiforme]